MQSDRELTMLYLPVSESDFDALAEIRIEAMRESLERIARFDPTRARERLRKSFYPEHSRIVCCEGKKIGFFTFRPTEDGYRLDHLYILPTWQSQGIGSHVLSMLIVAADEKAQPIRLGALKESQSNQFYQRHGFWVETEDQWDTYYVRPAKKTKNGG